ncbi:hypothetical protein ACFLTA_00485 [Bacteroidota bacterium]
MIKKRGSLLLAMSFAIGMVSLEAKNPQTDISFINYFDVPCYAASVELDANDIYPLTGLPPGSPLMITIQDGRSIPAFYSREKARIYTHLSMECIETMNCIINPADEWMKLEDYMTGDWIEERGWGLISNGLVAADYSNEGIDFYYVDPLTGEKSADIVTDMHYTAWIDDTLNGMMTPGVAEVMGLTRFEMLKADIVNAAASVTPEYVRLEITKKYNEVLAEDIEVKEVLTIYAHQPVCEYAVTLNNTGERILYLGNVQSHETAINGEYGEHIKSDRIILERHSVTQKNIPHYIPHVSILEEGYRTRDWLKPWTYKGWGDKLSYVENPQGYGLGICLLKKQKFDDQWMRWVTWMDAFSIPSSTEYSTVPAELTKGRPAEMGIALVPVQPGTPGFDQTTSIYHAIMDGNSYRYESPVAVNLGGELVKGPEILNFDGMRDDLWACSKGSLESNPAGISLKAGKDGGTASLAFMLDMDNEPVMTIEVTSVTKNTEFSLVLRDPGANNDDLELLVSSESVKKYLNLKELTGWEGLRPTIVELNCIGKKGASIDLEYLQILPSPLQAPETLYPSKGMDITDIATSFSWRLLKDVVDYEIQVAENENFSDPVIYKRAQKARRPGQRVSWFSHQMLDTGKWYWRIRAVSPRGIIGTWSEPVAFTVNDDHSKRPLVREITAENPLFVIDTWGAEDLSLFEDKIPADLKPYIAVNWPSVHDYYGEPSKDGKEKDLQIFHNISASLCHMERIFSSSDKILGLEYGEDPGDLERMKRMIMICAKYGRHFIFSDGNFDDYNKWQKFFSDPEFSAFLKEHSDYVRLIHKTNRPFLGYLSMGNTMGGWLDGQCGGLAMHMEAGWYWDEAGFKYKLDEYLGRRGGDKHAQPPNFWNQNAIIALTQGASAVFFAGQEDATMLKYDPSIHKEFWKEPHHGNSPDNVRYAQFWDSHGNVTPITNWYLWPFLRAVIERNMVPSQEEVIGEIKATVLLDEKPDLGERDNWMYGPYEPLYQNTYGIRHGGEIYELMPNNGRYYWFPVMPYGSSGIEGKANLKFSELQDEKSVKDAFDKLYPERSKGGAWVCLIGEKFYILSGHENRSDMEGYNFALGKKGIRNISGEIGAHKYIIGRTYEGGNTLWLQVNTEYIEDDTEIFFKCDSKPQVKVSPEDAVQTNKWDSGRKILSIRLSHQKGAVDLELQ